MDCKYLIGLKHMDMVSCKSPIPIDVSKTMHVLVIV
jgi:cyclophilin family peptidyl-prolyl cis-trans isomerase